MLLHIGENRFVPSASVVAIVPADKVSADTERLIRRYGPEIVKTGAADEKQPENNIPRADMIQ